MESKFQLIYYQKANGEIPILEFLKEQPIRDQKKLFGLFQLLESQGNNLREPQSKPLKDGIVELRIKGSTGAIRVLYFFFIGQKIVLTNAAIKKSMKLPASVFQQARKYREDFISRIKEIDNE